MQTSKLLSSGHAARLALISWAALLMLALALGLGAPAAWAVEEEASSLAAASSAPASDETRPAAAEGTDAAASSGAASSKASSSSGKAARTEPQIEEGPFADAVLVDLADGIYLIENTMEGGSGKAYIASPMQLEVVDGCGVVTAVWSSPNYDYMLVNGKKYLPTTTKPTSTFEIPVTAYDEAIDIVGDTTAMSAPHEVDYQITFALDSVAPFDQDVLDKANSFGQESASTAKDSGEEASDDAATTTEEVKDALTMPWKIFIVCAILSAVIIGIAVGVIRGYRNR